MTIAFHDRQSKRDKLCKPSGVPGIHQTVQAGWFAPIRMAVLIRAFSLYRNVYQRSQGFLVSSNLAFTSTHQQRGAKQNEADNQHKKSCLYHGQWIKKGWLFLILKGGVPSLSLNVLLISFGITTLPRSSILLTIPVAFISQFLHFAWYHYLVTCCKCSICKIYLWGRCHRERISFEQGA